MKTIWKYDLEVNVVQGMRVPEGYEILCVQVQNDVPYLWIEVNPDEQKTDLIIKTYGTGHDMGIDDSFRRYIGTYQLLKGGLVFHVFEDQS